MHLHPLAANQHTHTAWTDGFHAWIAVDDAGGKLRSKQIFNELSFPYTTSAR
jgi:hypothetical protein